MIKITNDSKVFVLCPKDSVTGGAELLHQIVHVLNENHRNAYLIYFDPANNNEICSGEIASDYKKYNIQLSEGFEDNENNVLVLYEAIFNKVLSAKNIQVMLWWLSVDNFYYTSDRYLSVSDYLAWKPMYGAKIILYRTYNFLFKGKNYFKDNISLTALSKMDYLNAYQSEYAQNFLENNKFRELLPLKDFINDEFFDSEDHVEKSDIILYNPKKGIEFTQKIINAFPHYKWIPLEKMTRTEMIGNLKKAKLYIDFGFHPGKDRIPREAVMSGACIITGYDGSAGFFEDVSIYRQYKLEKKDSNIQKIGNLVGDILKNYEKHTLNFDFYRERVCKEKAEFIIQVLDIFKPR